MPNSWPIFRRIGVRSFSGGLSFSSMFVIRWVMQASFYSGMIHGCPPVESFLQSPGSRSWFPSLPLNATVGSLL